VSQQRKSNSPVVITTDVSTGQDVDIDSLEVDILIICRTPAAFQQSASYLSRRGWPTTVVGNLSKAIDFIVKNSPDFVLISCNHPNPGTIRLPGLLATMNTQVIHFAELSDAGSTAKLATLLHKNKLQGLPSGTNIQRTIRRLLMDMYAPNKSAGEGGSLSVDPTNPNAQAPFELQPKRKPRVKNQGEEDTMEMGNYKISVKKERKKLKTIKKAVEGDQQTGSSGLNADEKKALLALAAEKAKGESGMMFLPTKGEEEPSNREIAYAPTTRASAEDPGLSYTPPPADTEDVEQISAMNSANDPLLDEPDIIQKGPAESELYSAVQEGPGQGKLHSIVQEGPSSGQEFSAVQAGPSRGKEHSAKKSPTQRKEVHWSEGQDTDDGTRHPEPFNVNQSAITDKKLQTLFARAIKEALARSCISGDEQARPLKMVEVVGTLPVESTLLHGYLVISISGAPADIHLDILKSFRLELNKLLRKAGVQADVDEGFAITLEKFNFLEWVRSEGSLAFVTDHQGAQVAVSFLATQAPVPQARESEKQDMAKIEVDHIDTEYPVPFKAYLHFKRSDRLYLYLRNGRRLYEEQKERLRSRQVNDFYIKAIDIANFKTYSAASFITRTARRFKPPQAS
jgi:hypothetical protein